MMFRQLETTPLSSAQVSFCFVFCMLPCCFSLTLMIFYFYIYLFFSVTFCYVFIEVVLFFFLDRVIGSVCVFIQPLISIQLCYYCCVSEQGIEYIILIVNYLYHSHYCDGAGLEAKANCSPVVVTCVSVTVQCQEGLCANVTPADDDFVLETSSSIALNKFSVLLWEIVFLFHQLNSCLLDFVLYLNYLEYFKNPFRTFSALKQI